MQNKKPTKKTQLGVTEAPKRRGRPRKVEVTNVAPTKKIKAIKTVKAVKTVRKPVKTLTVTNFMEKASEAASQSTQKMMFVSANSLKNLKWIKEGDRLEFLPGVQRSIVAKHIERLVESIQKFGMIRPVTVVEVNFFDGVTRRYVADGQHSLMACLRLGIPVPYILVDGVNDKQELTTLVTMLNSSSKSWKQGDYVNAWAESIEDYKELIKLKQKFDLDYDVVISASTGRDGGQNIKDLKKGLFRMENPTKAHLTCSRVANLLTLVPKMDRWSTRALVRAAVAVFSEQDYTPTKHKKLMEYVKENADQLRFCTSAKEIALAFLRKGL